MKCVILILMLFTCNLFAQQRGVESPKTILIQAFNNGAISSYGSSTLLNKVENIYAINPSGLSNFNKLSLGISYQAESKIDEAYIADIGYERLMDVVPESFGIVYPLENLVIGFGFGQTYNGKLDFGEIEITTVENPDGTGETFRPVFETKIHSYSAVLSYSFENIFNQDEKFNLGLRLNNNILYNKESLNKIGFDDKTSCISLAVGASYYKDISLDRRLGIGLSYESVMEFSKNVTYKDYNSGIISPDSDTTRPPHVIISQSFKMTGRVPGKLILDVDYDVDAKLKILGGISWVFWNDSGNSYDDQLNFSGSAVIKPAEFINLSAGFFTSIRTYNTDELENFFDVESGYYGIYLTAGSQLDFSGFNLDLSVADSHLLSGDWRKQTIVKLGFGYGI